MGSPKEQTVTSKTEPWKEAKPYFTDLYNKAQGAFDDTNRQVYGGDFFAGPNANQQAAVGGMAGNQFGQGAAGLNTMADDLVSGKYLDPATNPFLQTNVNAAIGDVNRNYTQQILPGLGDAAIRSGAYGGSRQGMMEGLAAGEYTREAGDIAQQMYGANYNAERDRQLGAGSLYNQANALQLQQLEGLAGAGSQQQQWEQAALDEEYQKYQLEQQAPWIGIPELLSVLTGGSFQTTASTGPNPNYTNPMQTIMGLMSGMAGLKEAWG